MPDLSRARTAAASLVLTASTRRRSLPEAKAVTTKTQRHKERPHKDLMSHLQAVCTVADAIPLDSKIVEQRQMEVREERILRITKGPPAFGGAGAPPRQQQWNVSRVMGVALTHAGSIHQCGVVQQGPVAIGS